MSIRHKGGTARRLLGFTLIELMITVAVIGILAAIAFPSFIDQIRKSRRADAKAELTNQAQKIERDYTLNNSYSTAVNNVIGASGVLSSEKHYQVVATSSTASTYTLEARPQGDQANDKCKNLTLTSTGVKNVNGGTITNPSQCW